MSLNVLRLPAVIKYTGKSRSSIYQAIQNGTFPKQIKLGARSSGWLESEIISFIEKCVKDSRSAEGDK